MSNKRRRFAASQKAAIVLEVLKEEKSITPGVTNQPTLTHPLSTLKNLIHLPLLEKLSRTTLF
jgi:hypothetical protein